VYASTNEQALESMINGWTRIDMLLALYERCIDSVQAAKVAQQNENDSSMRVFILEAQKTILALHSGLKTDEDEVAQNIARLLNFILLRIEEQEFDEANRFLEQLHGSFLQIREAAVELEAKGVIPPISNANVIDTVA
jgi:flagellin-specific chaperone FliS